MTVRRLEIAPSCTGTGNSVIEEAKHVGAILRYRAFVWGEKTCWRGRFQIALSVGKEAARDGGGGWLEGEKFVARGELFEYNKVV